MSTRNIWITVYTASGPLLMKTTTALFHLLSPAFGLLFLSIHSLSAGEIPSASVLQISSSDLTAPPVAITSPISGSTFGKPDPITVTIKLDPSVTGPRSVRILNNNEEIGAASPNSFIHGWQLPDGSIIGFQSKTMFNYIHEDEYFFFDGAFTNNRFSGNFSAHSIGGMVRGTGTLDVAFDANGLLTVATSGDAPLGVRNLTGGQSTTCMNYRFMWKNPPAGQQSLTAELTYTDITSGETLTFVSQPVSITIDSPPAPEISVEQPLDSVLRDGARTTKFGTVKIGKGKSKTYTIRNKGQVKLTGLDITVNGANPKDFIVTQPLKTVLTPDGYTTFKVTFKPRAKGTRTAAIHIKSNDADESPFDIKLTGIGANP